MENIVWVLGGLIAVWGIVTIILPNWMKAAIQFIAKGKMIYGVIASKILFGLLFLIFARECRIPWVILVVGLLSAGGSILFCGLPFKKIQLYLEWWKNRPLWLYRAWGVLAAAFGALVMYAGVPAAEKISLSLVLNAFLA